MLEKIITLTHSTRGEGFDSVLRYSYLLRCDADAASLDNVPKSGDINLPGEPLWSGAEDPAAYAADVAALFDGDICRCNRRGRFRGNPVYHVAVIERRINNAIIGVVPQWEHAYAATQGSC